eukprot:gene24421-10019_t
MSIVPNLGGAPNIMCKIEMPAAGAGDEQYGGTRAIQSAYTWSHDQQIGEGTYGQVFLGNDNISDDKVALKKIRMDTEKEGFPITAIREIKILSTLQHENVVNLREIVRSEIHKNNNYKGSIYMVFDYADYDLTGLMETVKYKFTEAQVKCIMKQLLKGLAYVHSNGVLHRDLKASNILIDCKGMVKLADFGLARTYQDRQEGRLTNRVITLWYRPPELLLGADRYGPEIDIWEKVAKERYKGDRLEQWVKDQSAKQGQHVKKDAVDLLKKMLALDPAKRISAVDAFQDKWFWSEPMPCDPQDLPCSGSSHEFTMKKRRQEEKEREEQHRNASGVDPGRALAVAPLGARRGGRVEEGTMGPPKPAAQRAATGGAPPSLATCHPQGPTPGDPPPLAPIPPMDKPPMGGATRGSTQARAAITTPPSSTPLVQAPLPLEATPLSSSNAPHRTTLHSQGRGRARGNDRVMGVIGTPHLPGPDESSTSQPFTEAGSSSVNTSNRPQAVGENKGEGVVTLEEAREKVAALIEGRTLVGHALHHDLEALKLDHPRIAIRDTAGYPPLMW